MCGIAGGFGREPLDAPVRAMTAALAHRGPDGAGLLRLTGGEGTPGGVFGHRRLAVIDLSEAGAQPMVSSSGRLTLTFNGEIYNYHELRRELAAGGVTFRSTSDTEVLLAGWERHGPAFLRRIRGMFAFALWDRERGCAYLARDGFGIKPLYLTQQGPILLFASEIRALLASGRVPARLSWPGVRSFLATGSVSEPRTIIERIRAVPPGTFLEVGFRGAAATIVSSSEFDGHAAAPVLARAPLASRPAAAAAVREALRASVARHLVADVPVALFLSGGVDSSALVAVASEVAAVKLDTFTVTFAEPQFDEGAVARTVAQRFGTRHHEVPLSARACLDALPDAFASMDQPSMDGLNTFVVSRAVRAAGVKVALSGLGGDELFAGYPSFGRARRLVRLRGTMSPLLGLAGPAARRLGGGRGEKLAALLGHESAARAAYTASRMLLGPAGIHALTGAPWTVEVPAPPPGLSALGEVSWYEATGYMRNTLLRDSDVFSMAHGLELRVPFVDAQVAAAAAAAADTLKLHNGTSKPLLIAAVEDLLPREVWNRPKRGFTLPFDRWLRQELRSEVASLLTQAGLAPVGIEARAAVRIWRDFLRSRPGVGWSRPWALYTLARWARQRGITTMAPAEPALARVV